jgi:[ribosomal protein S5]-alanine N-acetyltransferase
VPDKPEPPPRVELRGTLTSIRPFETGDAGALFELRERNRDFFSPFEPTSAFVAATVAEQAARLASEREEWEADKGFAFAIVELSTGTLVGRIGLSHVARGGWQNAILGYYVDRDHNGKGFATDAVRLAVRFAFEHAGLHRLGAGVMPRNRRSIRVLEKAGFRSEGVSPRYLEIKGVWEDHELFAITREEWTP